MCRVRGGLRRANAVRQSRNRFVCVAGNQLLQLSHGDARIAGCPTARRHRRINWCMKVHAVRGRTSVENRRCFGFSMFYRSLQCHCNSLLRQSSKRDTMFVIEQWVWCVVIRDASHPHPTPG